jgi:hypothetical protein
LILDKRERERERERERGRREAEAKETVVLQLGRYIFSPLFSPKEILGHATSLAFHGKA